MGFLDTLTQGIITFIDWLRENKLFATILFFAVLLMGTFVINALTNVVLTDKGYMCGFEFHNDVVSQLSLSNNSGYDGTLLYDSITSFNRGDWIYNATTDQFEPYVPNTWYQKTVLTIKSFSIGMWSWIKGKFGSSDIENAFGQTADTDKYNETVWNVMLRDYAPVQVSNDRQTYDFNEAFGFRCNYPDKQLTFYNIAVFDYKMYLLLVIFGFLISFAMQYYQLWK